MTLDLQIFYLREDEFPQFNRKTNGTVVVSKPEAEFLLDLAAVQVKKLKQHPVEIDIGAAFHHPKDNFSKLEGRSIALSRLKRVPFLVEQIVFAREHVDFMLEGTDPALEVRYQIQVRVYQDSRALRIMGIDMRQFKGSSATNP